jgi:threonine aldolase
MIDLRSDTVTRPSKAMLGAMTAAEVGDDVFGEDPTTNRLQKRVAELFGKEDALFVASGVMGNQVCIKTHTEPGDEVIVEQDSHIVAYETAAPSLLSGVQLCTIAGEKGVLTASQLEQAVRPRAYYLPRTALVCLENTHGRSGGAVIPLDAMRQVWEFAQQAGLKIHLDGARIWNACVATGIQPKDYARYVDSLSVCFSKGLGAPVGSMIISTHAFVEKARKYRKIFGGGMRQVGLLAAAADYALTHNVDRLKEDHLKAKVFAEELARGTRLGIDLSEVQTNMVIAETRPLGKSQAEVLNLLKAKGLLLTSERSSAVRAVMHLDVSMEQVREAAAICTSLFA